MSSKLTQPDMLNLTTVQAADIGTFCLVGEVIGALVFGRFSDKLGRRKLFMWTLAVYLGGTALTAFTGTAAGSSTCTRRGSPDRSATCPGDVRGYGMTNDKDPKRCS